MLLKHFGIWGIWAFKHIESTHAEHNMSAFKKKAFSENCEAFVDSCIPEVRVVGGDRLRDARVEGADAGLGGRAKVSVALM